MDIMTLIRARRALYRNLLYAIKNYRDVKNSEYRGTLLPIWANEYRDTKAAMAEIRKELERRRNAAFRQAEAQPRD